MNGVLHILDMPSFNEFQTCETLSSFHEDVLLQEFLDDDKNGIFSRKIRKGIVQNGFLSVKPSDISVIVTQGFRAHSDKLNINFGFKALRFLNKQVRADCKTSML